MARKDKHTRKIKRVAKETFGFNQLRPGQGEAVNAVLEGHDTLVVMPTGLGKSAIYQIAAMLEPGPTIVVSPLIALQQDQVETLEGLDAGRAALLNSHLKASERKNALQAFKNGDIEFLFLAPEQLGNEQTLAEVKEAEPSLIIVDEAHCISEWGHDFRPSYLRLGAVIETLDHPTVLALTATASPLVREEIVQRLGMREPWIIVKGLDRPNIWLEVKHFSDEVAKQKALIEQVTSAPKPGIVYVATRRRADEIAGLLHQAGVQALSYHAGMKSEERNEVQAAFMNDEAEVIVATIAFGMGIDKDNVRFVYHYDISGSVDAYYQEIGRAGRDEEEAEAILFYNPGDLKLQRFFAGGGQVEEDDIQQVIEVLPADGEPVDVKKLKQETHLSDTKLITALNRLEDVGAVRVEPNGEVAYIGQADNAEIVEEAAQAQENHHEFEQSRIDMMRGYAELGGCRRAYLLNYFGQKYNEACGFCDNCEAGTTPDHTITDQPFPVNSRVTHEMWGEGTVLRYEADKIFVLFDEVGYKTLAVPLVTEGNLLEQV